MPTDNNQKEWGFTTGDRILSSPGVSGRTVIVGSLDGNLYGINIDTGQQQWVVTTDSRIVSSPTVVDSTAYFGSLDGNMYAVWTDTGKQRWCKTVGGSIESSPLIIKEKVIFGAADNTLRALDTADGSKQWIFEVDNKLFSSPTEADGTVFVGSDGGKLYAVDTNSGTQRWKFETNGSIRSSPTVANGTVFVGSEDNHLYAVGVETGNQEWELETNDAVFSSPFIANNSVFVGSDDGSLYAVDADTGDQQWVFDTGEFIRSSPVVTDDLVLCGGWDNNLYAVNANTGIERWKFETDGGIISTPKVTGEKIIFGSNDTNLYALNVPERTTHEDGDHSDRTNKISPDVDSVINTAEIAMGDSNFGKAADQYSQAISMYQATREQDKEGATGDDYTEQVRRIQDELEVAQEYKEQYEHLTETLQSGENSFQEAICAYIEPDRTLTRLRFRQARDSFSEAIEIAEKSDTDLIGSEISIRVRPDLELPEADLTKIQRLSQETVSILETVGIETTGDVDGSDEEFSEEVPTVLTILSWWSENSYEFESVDTISNRCEQANQAFNRIN